MFLMLTCFFLFKAYLNGQDMRSQFSYVRHINGLSPGLHEGLSTVVDSKGNVYVAGTMDGRLDLDPGPDTVFTESVNNTQDMVIVKFTSSGEYIKGFRIGGDSLDAFKSICVDKDDNLYIAGFYSNTVDFDPSQNTFELTSNGNTDGFVMKMDSAMNFIWVKKIASKKADRCNFIAMSGNDILVTGFFSDSFSQIVNGQKRNFFTNGQLDLLIVKFTDSGNVKWLKTFGSAGYEDGMVIKSNSKKDVVVGVNFGGVMDADPGTGYYAIGHRGSSDIGLVCLDSNGNFNWANSIGTSNSDYLESLDLDKNNNIYFSGNFIAGIDLDPGSNTYNVSSDAGSRDVLMVKLNSSGVFQWGFRIGGSAWEISSAIAVDTNNYVYICGLFGDSVNFDKGNPTLKIGNRGLRDVYICKYDQNSNFVWVKSYGGPSLDRVHGMVIAKDFSIYTTGEFLDSANFKTEKGTYFVKNNNFGSLEIFLHKIEQCHISRDSQLISACNNYISPSGKYIFTKSGVYYDTIASYSGCDSIIKLKLIVSKTNQALTYINGCNIVKSPSGNYFWTKSGTYYDTIPTVMNCDSALTCVVKVYSNSTSLLNISACDFLISPSKKYTWTSDGTYYDTIKNKRNCDSVITINLKIIKRSYSNINISACTQLISPSGRFVWSSNGVYIDTIPNHQGCDSVITVNLTILPVTYKTIHVTSCNHFISPSGKFKWTYGGQYVDTIDNFLGCDSIITIILTVKYNSTSYLRMTACDSALSPSGKFIWHNSGIYFDTLTSFKGCDSIIEVEVTVKKSSIRNYSFKFCEGESVKVNNVTYSQEGQFYDTLLNKAGCDSILSIDVEVYEKRTISIERIGNFIFTDANADSFQWLECSNAFSIIPASNNDSIFVVNSGDYAVVAFSNGCSDTSECINFNSIDVNGISNFSIAKVYPIPSGTEIYFDFPKASKLRISSTNGQLIFEKNCNSGLNSIDIHEWKPGIYYAFITSDQVSSVVKLVVITE